ncbi:hypothetical protein [Planctobacterium marinum]|uniref:hypothetical protein n=1 Tax=Planctobacterium marinum TaxID=1631968 RepID=UPI001E4002E0|nr:hypothetical protein [Planctobacterium marinum]MCC2605157.1 hypothetical protein [Planctobacterium marinum]
MNSIDLFGIATLTLPQEWLQHESDMKPDKSLNFGSQVPEIVLLNQNHEAGNLTIKCYQFDVKDEQQQQHLINSVYPQADYETITEGVLCDLEELRGEEDGEDIVVTRWRISSIKNADKFVLMTFSFSAALADLNSDAVNADISNIENAIKQANW